MSRKTSIATGGMGFVMRRPVEGVSRSTVVLEDQDDSVIGDDP